MRSAVRLLVAPTGASERPAETTIGPTPLAAWPGVAVGIALFTAVLAWRGIDQVWAVLAAGGVGIFGVAAFHVVPMLADALGWRWLLDPGRRPGTGTMLFARWVGESVNGLLPVFQIGGNVAKARVLARRGVPAAQAAASVVVDVSLVVTSQIGFTLLGLGLLLVRLGGGRLAVSAALGVVLLGSAVVGFVMAQRRGLFAAAARTLAYRSGRGARFAEDAAAIDAEVTRLWGQSGRLAASVGWHLASWVVGVGEVWLALRILGHPVDLADATLLESLAQAVRAAAFTVPAALGVQESGLLLLGATVGVAPATALALSLTKRVREVVLGVPGLVAWQIDVMRARRRAEMRTG